MLAVMISSSFLSTPSARRATVDETIFDTDVLISIHALREEGDGMAISSVRCFALFLSTPSVRRATEEAAAAVASEVFLSMPSVRRATYGIRIEVRRTAISIHALREEGDQI